MNGSDLADISNEGLEVLKTVDQYVYYSEDAYNRSNGKLDDDVVNNVIKTFMENRSKLEDGEDEIKKKKLNPYTWFGTPVSAAAQTPTQEGPRAGPARRAA